MFKDLIVWQKSVELAKLVYRLTDQFPRSQKYSLSQQIQRSSVSIASNIAEGHSRNHRREFVQFLGIAFGSSAELETQLIIAKSIYSDLDYSQVFSILIEVQKMLITMIKRLR